MILERRRTGFYKLEAKTTCSLQILARRRKTFGSMKNPPSKQVARATLRGEFYCLMAEPCRVRVPWTVRGFMLLKLAPCKFRIDNQHITQFLSVFFNGFCPWSSFRKFVKIEILKRSKWINLPKIRLNIRGLSSFCSSFKDDANFEW